MAKRLFANISRFKVSSCLVAVASLALCAGCSCEAGPREYKVQTETRMKNLLLAIYEYREANENHWPDELIQIKEYLGGLDFEETVHNSFTGDRPGFEYVKPPNNCDPAITVILYQLREGQRDTSLSIGFADGSVRQMP